MKVSRKMSAEERVVIRLRAATEAARQLLDEHGPDCPCDVCRAVNSTIVCLELVASYVDSMVPMTPRLARLLCRA